MTISTGTRAVVQGMIEFWDATGIEQAVKDLRDDPAAPFSALYDTEAEPNTPFPFVVFTQSSGFNLDRQSPGASSGNARQWRMTRWRFLVYSGSKVIAANIADLIMRRFESCIICVGTSAGIVLHDNDWGIRSGRDEFSWVVDFQIRYDAEINK